MNPKQQTFLSILLLVSAFTLSRAEVTTNVDSLEFNDVPVGKSLKQHAILGNNGSSRIDIQSVEIIGDDAEFFSTTYTEKLPRFIYPGNTPWMKVFFTPTEPGLFSAELILNLSDGNQLRYPLDGGTTDNTLGVVLNVNEFDFGVVEPGDREKLYGIFENLGTLRTDIQAATITGPDADLFSSTYVDKLPRFIYPGSTPWMPVYYQPDVAGSHRATLTLSLSDGSEMMLPLRGGEDRQGGGELTLLSGNINFQDTFVTQSQTEVISVLNNEATGGPSAIISNIQIQNSNFSVSNALPISLAPGESADLNIVFNPESTGFQEDTLVVISENTQLSVQVNGTGIALPQATLEISPEQIDFGDADVGESINRIVTISNTQTNPPAAATISSLAFTEPVFSIVNGPTLPTVLPSGESLDLTIKFAPSEDLLYLDALVVNNDFSITTDVFGVGSGEGGELSAALEFVVDDTTYGNADRPIISLGSTNVGQSQFVSVLIKNPTASEMGAITAINLTGTNTTSASILDLPQFPLQLAAGESIELEIQVTAENNGAINQTLSITTDPLVDDVNFELNLSGEIVLDASIGTVLIGVSQGTISLELGGFSNLSAGELARIDPNALGTPRGLFVPNPGDTPRWGTYASENPAGANLLFDLYDAPAPCNPRDGIVDGLAYSPDGIIFATHSLDSGVPQQDEGCINATISKLAVINLETETQTIIAEIIDDQGNPIRHIAGISINPITGELFLGTSVEDACQACLFTVNTVTGTATKIKQYTVDQVPWIGGIAFDRIGALYLVNVSGPGFTNNPRELLTIDPNDGEILNRETIKLEQQLEVRAGGRNLNITSAGFSGLTINPDGELVASWANGGTSLYKRIQGIVKDKFGNPVTGEEEWVWTLLGDSGEWFAELEYVELTEPSSNFNE